MARTPIIRSLMRPHLLNLEPYEGVDPPEVLSERSGIPTERIVKLNGNENPYGPSPKVASALACYMSYHIYTDPLQRRVRQALSEYADTTQDRIVAGAGSDELIDLLMRLFLDPGDTVIQCTPTFGMYESFAEICGARVLSIPRGNHFEIDLPKVLEAARRGAKMAFIASPNNPTGDLMGEDTAREILATGMLVVIDEAYFEFAGSTLLALLGEYPNLVVLRTFSKWAGLASLRLGYGIMDEAISERLMTIKPPYNISIASELALFASLEDKELLLSRVEHLAQSRDELYKSLLEFKELQPIPSKANFILCRGPLGKGRWLYERLAEHGVFVRYYSNPLLENYIRITVGLPDENKTLREALKVILS